MALTRPKIKDLDTSIIGFLDPITVLHQGATSANVDVGFLFNRANGLVSNVALYWSESSQSFITSFTANTGVTNANITPSSYANLTIGSLLTINGAAITLSTGTGLKLNGSYGNSGDIVTSTGTGVQWAPAGGFSGGTVPNQLIANAGTASSSTTTGAFLVTGGQGITGNLYVGGNIVATGTSHLQVPVGTTAQRPGTGANGMMRYNSTITSFEGYYAGAWSSLGGVKSVDGKAYIQAETSAGAGDDVIRVYAGDSGTSTQVMWASTSNIKILPTTSATNTTSGALQIAGGAGIAGSVYAAAVYDNGTRVVSTSTGAGNLTISSGAINLTSHGPGASAVGSSTAIPIITPDVYGRIATLSTAAVIAPAGTLSGSTLNSTVTASSLTSVGNLTSVSIAGTSTHYGAASFYTAPVPGANSAVNLGSTTAWWSTIYGKATQAQYADLAENYTSDDNYPPGTVVVFGGEQEITVTDKIADTRVAGVISTNPAYLMNAVVEGLPVAFTGRVPCQVKGPVNKGDVLVTSNIPGVAQRIGIDWQPGCVLGKALTSINNNNIETIEVVVGRF